MKKNWSDILGILGLYIYFLSFFWQERGIRTGILIGILALLIKKFIYKEKIEVGPKVLAYSNLYILIGVIIIDIIHYSTNLRMRGFDRYSIFLMYFVALNYIKTKKIARNIFYVFMISIFISYVGAFPHVKILMNNPNYRIRSFLNIMAYSHRLAISSTFILGTILYCEKKIKKIPFVLLGISYSISVVLVLLSKTRGAILSMLISQIALIIYYIIFERKFKSIIITLLLISSVLLVLPQSILQTSFSRFGNSFGSDNLRVIFWKASIDGFREKPLIGWGTSRGSALAFEEYFEKEELTDYVLSTYGRIDGNSHNSYFQTLLRHGVLVGGYILFYLLIILPVLWIKKYKEISEGWKPIYKWLPFGFLGFYISMLTENVLATRNGNLLVILITLIAMCIMNFKFKENEI